VKTKKFTRNEESGIGADWYWVLISPTGRTLILFIQAKKLFTKTNRYSSLMNSTDPLHQVNKLLLNNYEDKLLGLKMYPLYVFYNYFVFNPTIECNCSKSLNIEIAGCSCADAVLVKQKILKKRNHLCDLLDIQFPLRCLICSDYCNNFGAPSNDVVTNAFNKISSFQDRIGTYDSLERPPITESNLITERPPEILERILAGQDFPSDRLSEFNGLISFIDQRERKPYS
jgi:hypothetical protein